jgi:hypothetical protein
MLDANDAFSFGWAATSFYTAAAEGLISTLPEMLMHIDRRREAMSRSLELTVLRFSL